MTLPNEQSNKQFVVNESLDYLNGLTHFDVINTACLVAQGSTTGGAVANTTVATISVTAGQRLQILRVWGSVEGTSGVGHFDFRTVAGEYMPLGYLPAPGEFERVGTFKDPILSFINATALTVALNLTISAPVAANTYSGCITYTVMDDTRPSV